MSVKPPAKKAYTAGSEAAVNHVASSAEGAAFPTLLVHEHKIIKQTGMSKCSSAETLGSLRRIHVFVQ